MNGNKYLSERWTVDDRRCFYLDIVTIEHGIVASIETGPKGDSYARLIAMAPRLLEAVKRAIDGVDPLKDKDVVRKFQDIVKRVEEEWVGPWKEYGI